MALDKAALGAWEDLPRRNLDIDVTSAPLNPSEAFLLSRIDGQTSTAELCAMSGLGEGPTVEGLGRLLEAGLIGVEEAPGDRRLIAAGPAVPARRQKRGVPHTKQKVRHLPPFYGVSAKDMGFLSRYGVFGFVPGTPIRLPGQGRYGTFEWDRRLLLQRSVLTIDQKRDVIFLSENLKRMDHFELFGIEPSDDRRAMKRGYFAFSKRYHPDTFYGKELGAFHGRMDRVFKHGTDVYNTLTQNAELRRIYAAAVTARNAAFRTLLEDERIALQATQRKAKLVQATGRKVDLRARLERNMSSRRSSSANPAKLRIERAKRFYDEGMEQYSEERFLSAAASLKLALTYDPNNEDYQQASARVSEKAQQVQAEQHWKRGFMEESLGRLSEATVHYLRATDIYSSPNYCIHTADLLLQTDGDLRKAADLALIAVKEDRNNMEYRLTLSRIYVAASMVKKAISTLEQAQKLEPKNLDIKKNLRALKRM